MAKRDKNSKACRDAVRLKYEGVPYADIAKQTRVPKTTIDNWFEKNGLLHNAYEEYALEMDALIRKENLADIRRGAQTAIKMLTALMGSKSDFVKLNAANSLLDRWLGKAKQPIELPPDPTDPDDMSYEQRLALFEKTYGKPPANNSDKRK
ncbi:hypothetical protein EPO34_03535 [Patescibacteria group bacterium]|nr:MAG: hypothetical protein EPO34_03535 [Patescibacteria group bacterium]